MQTIKLDTRLEDGQHFLDLGCGISGHSHAAYATRQCTVGLDLGFEDVQITRAGFQSHPVLQPETGPTRRYSLMVGDALSLPFPMTVSTG